jgi:hypothetical protein
MWYFERTWPIFDRKWLSLRDACHQRIFDKDPDLYQHRTLWDWEDSFPLSDVTHPAPSPSAADPNGVVLQQAIGNETSRSDEQNLQHLAIDVDPPTSSEHVDAEALVGAGGDRSLEEAGPEDAVIRMGSPI